MYDWHGKTLYTTVPLPKAPAFRPDPVGGAGSMSAPRDYRIGPEREVVGKTARGSKWRIERGTG